MIRTETIIIGDNTFVHTWSDRNVLIHGGSPEGDYIDAIDPADFGRTYTETDIPIDSDEAEAEEIVNILTGEEE